LRKEKKPLEKIFVILATLGYAGLFPRIPGTIGSLIGLLLYIAIFRLNPLLYALDLITLILFAIWVCERAEKVLGEKDSRIIIIDELVGILVTMCWIYPTTKGIIVGFSIFRLFDILKVPPIRWVERSIPSGYGVVLDDVVAGIYSNIILRLLLFFWS